MATPAAVGSSWPEAAKIRSKLTKKDNLVALCNKYEVPKELKPVRAGKRAACDAPPNALCVYSDALKVGLRFPLHSFYVELLQHYRLAPSQLVPNAWRYMVAFVHRCKDAGVEPLVSAFTHFFSVHATGTSAGWHHFIQPAGRRLFDDRKSSIRGWKEKFFFLECPEGRPWRCPVAWGNPRTRTEDASTVELTEEAKDAVRKLEDMPSVDFMDYWRRLLAHHPPVGALNQTQLHATLEAGDGARAADPAHEGDDSPPPKPRCPDPAAGEGDGSPPPKRWCPHPVASAAEAADESDNWTPREHRYPDPAAMAPPSFTISAAPQGMNIGPDASFNGASASSETSLPPGICTADAIRYHDLVEKPIADHKRKLRASEARCGKLVDELLKERAENDRLLTENARLKAEHTPVTKCLNDEHTASMNRLKAELMDELLKERAENGRLKTENARLKAEHTTVTKLLNDEHAASMYRLKAEHTTEVQQLTKHFNDEHTASMDRLKAAHATGLAGVKDAAEKVEHFHNRLMQLLCKQVDLSLLDEPELRQGVAAAGTAEASGTTASS